MILFFLQDEEEGEEDDSDYCTEEEEEEETSLEFGYYAGNDSYESEFDFEERFKEEFASRPETWTILHVRFSLFSHFFSVHLENEENWDVFFDQCKKDMKDFSSLLNKPCDLSGMTPLMMLWREVDPFLDDHGFMSCCFDLTRLAVSLGAELNLKDKNRKTLYDHFVENHRDVTAKSEVLLEVASVLKEYGLRSAEVVHQKEAKKMLSSEEIEKLVNMIKSQIPKLVVRAQIAKIADESEITNVALIAFDALLHRARNYMYHRRSNVLKPRDVIESLRTSFA